MGERRGGGIVIWGISPREEGGARARKGGRTGLRKRGLKGQ